MDNDPDYDNPHGPASRLTGASAAGNRSAAPLPAPVTLFVRRLSWEMHPAVYLRYDAEDDLLLARFVPSVTADQYTLDDRLFVGFDEAGPEARCTTVCIAGFTTDTSGNAHETGRHVLGETVWRAAHELAVKSSGDRIVILDSQDVASLLVAWSAFRQHLAPTVLLHEAENASPGIAVLERRTPTRRKGASGGSVKVDVISVTDLEIAEMLEQWSAEFARTEQARQPGARGLLQYAIHRGISSLRPVKDHDADRADGIIRGEWDLPDLIRIGVHSRVAWQIEPGNPPILVVKAYRIDPLGGGQADIEHRIEVRFGDRRGQRTSAALDRVGRLAVRERHPFGPGTRGRVSGIRNRHVNPGRQGTQRGRRFIIRGVRGIAQVKPRWSRKRRSA
jgi:hypothetical protein